MKLKEAVLNQTINPILKEEELKRRLKKRSVTVLKDLDIIGQNSPDVLVPSTISPMNKSVAG